MHWHFCRRPRLVKVNNINSSGHQTQKIPSFAINFLFHFELGSLCKCQSSFSRSSFDPVLFKHIAKSFLGTKFNPFHFLQMLSFFLPVCIPEVRAPFAGESSNTCRRAFDWKQLDCPQDPGNFLCKSFIFFYMERCLVDTCTSAFQKGKNFLASIDLNLQCFRSLQQISNFTLSRLA